MTGGQGAVQRAGVLVLAVVAGVGAVLSYASLYAAAVPTFGRVLAAGFPLLVDALVLGASLRYVAGARVGRPRAGWRLTAHAGVAATIALNALASPDLAHVPWHVTAPAVWSVLVELTARDVLGHWRAEHTVADRIPARLWWSAPVESWRTWLRMARVGQHRHADARLGVGHHAAAVEALRLAIGGRSGRRVRRVLRRQLRAGSLPPAAVLGACGWGSTDGPGLTPERVLRAALGAVLAPEPAPVGEDTAPAVPARQERAAAPLHTVPAPAPEPAGNRSMDDLRAELAEAIGSRRLPAEPSAEAIRKQLRISPARARQLRDGLRRASA